MPAPFSLAGLLRLRGIQQDQAAGTLAAANHDLRTARDRRNAASEHLAGTPAEADDAYSLMFIAASRASARSMFLELDTLLSAAETRAESARSDFAKAKSDTAALEKLRERHRRESTLQDLRTEQNALDEISSTRRTPVTGTAA